MSAAHWVITLFFAAYAIGVTVKIARDPDWSHKPGLMIVSVVFDLAIVGTFVWALWHIGALPWVAP